MGARSNGFAAARLAQQDRSPNAAFARATAGAQSSLPFLGAMESAFGEDFSDVQVFSGQDDVLADMGANAVTDGSRIAFGPERPSAELVAHELTHVVQHRQSGGGGVHASGSVSRGSDACEREAEAVARQAASGGAVDVSQRPGAGLQRDERDDSDAGPTLSTRTGWELSGQEPESPVSYASKPALLEAEHADGHAAYLDASGQVEDFGLLITQMDELIRKHDPEHTVITPEAAAEYRGRAVNEANNIQLELAAIPTVDGREAAMMQTWGDRYTGEETADGWQILPDDDARFESRYATWQTADAELTAALADAQVQFTEMAAWMRKSRDELRPTFDTLLDPEVGAADRDNQAIRKGVTPLVPEGERRDEFRAKLDEKDAAIGALNVAPQAEGDAFGGKMVAGLRGQVAADQKQDANLAAIGAAEQRRQAFVQSLVERVDYDLVDMIGHDLYEHSDITNGAALVKIRNEMVDTRYELDDLKAAHIDAVGVPELADGAAYAKGVDRAIDSFERSFDQALERFRPMAEASQVLHTLANEARNRTYRANLKTTAALPNMREAVVWFEIEKRYERDQQWAEGTLARVEKTGLLYVSATELQARIDKLDLVEEQVSQAVGPNWYQHTGTIEALSDGMKEGNKDPEVLLQGGEAWTAEELSSADKQLDLAKIMSRYRTWTDKLDAAEEAVRARKAVAESRGDDERVARADATLAKLDAFRKQVNADLSKELGLVGPDVMAAAKTRLEDLKSAVGKLTDSPELADIKDPETFLRKVGVDQTWKRIIQDPEARKLLSGFGDKLGEAVTVIERLQTIDTILDSGDAVSVAQGSGHPAMDGLAAGMGLISEFNKVPVFGELVGFYVDVIKALSPAIAKLKNMTREKLLDLAILTGELHGRL